MVDGGKPKPGFYSDLAARELIKQVSDPSLEAVLARESLCLYIGFDPTADSLHLGSLLQLITLRRFQLAGHRPIALVGGATGLVGDPSFKSEERSLLSAEQVAANAAGIRKLIEKLLDTSGPRGAKVVNNADWMNRFSYLEFLRDVGKHFTINHMLGKESVRARLEDREHGISYTEFSYMLLQAYDFLHLNQKENCRLQVGGSDQWGNITAGIELVRRARAAGQAQGREEVFGLTTPLITKSDGTKFGKTESGTIWLSADRTSPYALYQYFLQTEDADVARFLKFFTFLPLEEISELEKATRERPELRAAQKRVAEEVVRMIHGEAELKQAVQASQALFSETISSLDRGTLMQALGGGPKLEKPRATLETGYPLVDALVESGLCPSKGQARKDIQAGAVSINNRKLKDPQQLLTAADLIAGDLMLLRKGKRHSCALIFGEAKAK